MPKLIFKLELSSKDTQTLTDCKDGMGAVFEVMKQQLELKKCFDNIILDIHIEED